MNNDFDDFLTLLQDGLGLPIEQADIGRAFDEVPGWDSVHLLWLLSAMEEQTGRRVALPSLLEATSLAGVFVLYHPDAEVGAA